MAKDSTLVWQEIDPTTLPQEIQQAYDRYKHQYAAMKADRQAFEAALNAYADKQNITGADQELACAYNFGKLSVAIAPKRERKAGKKAVGLGDLVG